MHELYELKEMLCKELEEYGKKGELTTGSLDVVDKLAHTVKNLTKIIEAYDEEGEYSGNYMYEGGQGRGGSYARGGNRGGGSYARGRGRNARRDSMGRYSSEGYSRASEEVVDQLRDLMEDVPENMKYEVRKLISKMESM